ncbi:MAG TPA: DUF3137 domain-containing protein [Acidothermaceae bacterium]|nr:DUF3137 domain-containing protein [Acidothermaceae bacterium]
MAKGGLFALVIVAVIAFAIWSYKRNQKRVSALQQYALANGWAYVARDDRQWTRWQQTPFNDGFDRRATNVLTGRHQGHDMVAFDYTYKTRTTDSKGNSSTQTHHYRVCALAMPTWLPTLEVGPENVLTRLGNVVGVHDIELESEDFNRRFRVHANDRKFAYDVLSPRTIERLMAMPAFHWRIDGQTIVSWDVGTLQIADLLPRLAALAAVVDGIPDFVWHDNGVPEQSMITPPPPITPPATPPVTPPMTQAAPQATPPTGGPS